MTGLTKSENGAAHSAAGLTVEGLSWRPAGGVELLHDISFSVAPGEVLALVGPNGAGKSSLLRCLYRYHRPQSGRVLLDGRDIWQMSAVDCARRIAAVVQETAGDFGLTVAEIVELGAIPHNRGSAVVADVMERLDSVGLAHLAHRDFMSLSGGEKQRVMIARALVQKPALLILDEPTNHLDIHHQLDLLDRLAKLGCTVIVSLHDLASASAHADRVIVMDAGRLQAAGAPMDVLTPERIRNTFAVNVAIDSHPATGRPRFSFHL